MAIQLSQYPVLLNDANLVNYWKFEGNSNDSKGLLNGVDANITYGTNNGKFSQGALFNGTSSKIDINGILNGTVSNFTVNAWVKLDSSFSTTSSIISQRSLDGIDGQWRFEVLDSKAISFLDYNGGVGIAGSSTGTLTVDVWTMVTFVKSTTNLYFYINGSPSGTITGTNKTYSNTIKSSIGYNRRDSNDYFNGNIDDVAIFTRSLSDAEVLNYYKATAGSFFNFF